jgi:hypothetical protein
MVGLLLVLNLDCCSQSVKNPPIALALRTRGSLILGLVRILERKVHFLYIQAIDVRSH